ncbi:hypothetical protein HC028_06045 [Planosporangium flavigriseum]|nr:hypothetical protein [Planosporangium flavigriseum]NJC64074.1 hypothetical protein [Planosporangium flavigriseum]
MAVRIGEERRRPSRRTVLRAALGSAAGAVSLAACDGPRSEAQQLPAPDPLNPFYHDTAALLGRYDAAIATQPALAERLGPIRDAHRTHLEALAREIGPGLDTAAATSPGPGPGEPSSLAALSAAEQAASAAAREACLRAPSYRAALLGSIAAARASHVAALS